MERNNILFRIVNTGGIVLTASVLWLVVYYIARGAIYLLDLLRGLDSDLLQGLGIELLTPGVAMYISLKICKSLYTNSWAKVGLVFSILLFFWLYFSFGNFIKPTYDSVKTFDTFFKIGFIVSILIGSVVSYFEIGKDNPPSLASR
jgi:hypothetical protein